MTFYRPEDLIGPDGVNQGYPNNVSRRATLAMEEKIRARFGEAEVIATRKACGARSDWNDPPARGSTSMYGADYRDPEPEQSFASFAAEMDEKDTEWREGAFPDGEDAA